MNVILLDTETTGLVQPSTVPLDRQPRIIEIGALKVDTASRKELGHVSQLIDPQQPISDEITKITGITDKDVEGQPTFDEFLPDLRSFFSDAHCLIAHNAEFDTTMLKLELARSKLPIKLELPSFIICTVEEFSHLIGYRPRLTDAYLFFTGQKLEQTHRAMDDVRALLTCCDKSGLFGVL